MKPATNFLSVFLNIYVVMKRTCLKALQTYLTILVYGYKYAESAASHTSNRSRTSRTSSRSSVQEKRANAAKVKLALQLAEEERRRTIEGGPRLLTIEKKITRSLHRATWQR